MGGPTIDPSILIPLLIMALGFTLFFVSLLIVRVRSEFIAARLRVRLRRRVAERRRARSARVRRHGQDRDLSRHGRLCRLCLAGASAVAAVVMIGQLVLTACAGSLRGRARGPRGRTASSRHVRRRGAAGANDPQAPAHALRGHRHGACSPAPRRSSLYAFQRQLVFFYSPTELMAKPAAPGRAVRLGGLVENGSVSQGWRRRHHPLPVTDLKKIAARAPIRACCPTSSARARASWSRAPAARRQLRRHRGAGQA